MSNGAKAEIPVLPSSGSLIATLGGLAMLSGLLVVLAYEFTLPRIAYNKKVALEHAVFTVLPGASTRANFTLTDTGIEKLADDQITEANVFAGYDDTGALVGLAMEGSARGYQDVVRVLYGFAPDRECIIGFTVLQSTETPGLGDRINSDEGFLANFECLEAKLNGDRTAMLHEVETVKHGNKTKSWQIDGISGATISSTAVGKALRESTNKMLPLLAAHSKGGESFRVAASPQATPRPPGGRHGRPQVSGDPIAEHRSSSSAEASEDKPNTKL